MNFDVTAAYNECYKIISAPKLNSEWIKRQFLEVLFFKDEKATESEYVYDSAMVKKLLIDAVPAYNKRLVYIGGQSVRLLNELLLHFCCYTKSKEECAACMTLLMIDFYIHQSKKIIIETVDNGSKKYLRWAPITRDDIRTDNSN